MLLTADIPAGVLARLTKHADALRCTRSALVGRLLDEALTRLDEELGQASLGFADTRCPSCGTPARLGHTLDCAAPRRS
jgi:hypothetical protein